MNIKVNKLKVARHARRKARVAGTLRGTTERPRLSVFRSAKNIAVQIIDDTTGRTLVAAGSGDKSHKTTMKHGGYIAAAKVIGKAIAEKAKAAGLNKVAFDRNGLRYHGRVKALAEAAREGGLQF
jgi:large subunit ribosomal protein L18